jgi:hypothetical protein
VVWIHEIRVIRGQMDRDREDTGDGVHRGWHGSHGWESTRRFDKLKAPSEVEGLTLAATRSGNRERSGGWYP